MVLTWNFMAFPKILLALSKWQKKIFVPYFTDGSTFSDAPISAKKWFYFVHVTGPVFTY